MKNILKKYLSFGALLLAAALSIAATGVTIIWYTQSPHTGSLAGSDVWSLQRTTPNRYYYSTVAELKTYVTAGLVSGTNGVSITNATIANITNLYTTTEYVTNLYAVTAYVTNLYAVTNYTTNLFVNTAYVTNLYSFTNTLINLVVTYETVTNLYAVTNYTTNLFVNTAYITNLYTENFYVTNLYSLTNWDYLTFVTNLYAGATYTTNLYVTNITAKNLTVQNFYSQSNYLDQLTITNQIYWVTNTWAGPTNVVNIGGPYDLNYAATSDCEVTGFTNKTSTTTCEVLLSIANGAATNIIVSLPASVVDGDYVSTHTITNATTGMFWLRYTPVGPRTNSVFRQL